MTAQTALGLAARGAGAFAAVKLAGRVVPALRSTHPVILAVAGWLIAGLVLDAAIPGKGD